VPPDETDAKPVARLTSDTGNAMTSGPVSIGSRPDISLECSELCGSARHPDLY
jgi:hypothetical protein